MFYNKVVDYFKAVSHTNLNYGPDEWKQDALN
jgi:hypothetical protein